MKNIATTITDTFSELSEGHYQTALLYSALAGAVVADVLPTPALAWAYYRMKVLQKQRESGLISASELENKIGKAYAYSTPVWWVGVFLAVHFKKGGFYEKAKLSALLVGVGAVVGYTFKQYVKNLPEFKEEK